MIADDEVMFENVFAKGKSKTKPEPSHQYKQPNPHPKKKTYPTTPFPKCISPPLMVIIPRYGWISVTTISPYTPYLKVWVEAATMHLEENAAKWWQTYKITHTSVSSKQFSEEVQGEFGSDDY